MTGAEMLHAWLKNNDMTQAVFAKSIGRSLAAVENIVAGRSTPSEDTAARIDEITEGAVPSHVWQPDTEGTQTSLYSHAEIAAELGITRQAVAAIEKQALRKLRRDPLLYRLWLEGTGIDLGWAEFA